MLIFCFYFIEMLILYIANDTWHSDEVQEYNSFLKICVELRWIDTIN